MIVIDILRNVKCETERHLEQLNSSSSRVYEISTSGTIVERTTQLRDFYQFIARQLQNIIDLLTAAGMSGKS